MQRTNLYLNNPHTYWSDNLILNKNLWNTEIMKRHIKWNEQWRQKFSDLINLKHVLFILNKAHYINNIEVNVTSKMKYVKIKCVH
jgi:hypothetical protein